MRLTRSRRGRICPRIPRYWSTPGGTCAASTGVPANRLSAYLRYIYEDYDDGSAPYNSGSAHMVLAGLTGTR